VDEPAVIIRPALQHGETLHFWEQTRRPDKSLSAPVVDRSTIAATAHYIDFVFICKAQIHAACAWYTVNRRGGRVRALEDKLSAFLFICL
jgi:hypothetical protein